MNWETIVIAVLSTALVQVVLRANRRARPVSLVGEDGFELRPSRLVLGVGVASLLFGAVLAAGTAYVLRNVVDVTTRTLSLVPLGAALLGAYLVIEGLTRVGVRECGVSKRGPFRAQVFVPWDAIESARYKPFGEHFILSGRCPDFRIDVNYRGFDAFVSELLVHVDAERVAGALAVLAKDKTLLGLKTWEVRGRRYEVGQIYRLRSPDPSFGRLRVTIGRVEYVVRLGFVVHVSLDGVPMGRDPELAIVNAELESIAHLPITEEALAASDLVAAEGRATRDDFEHGYQSWRWSYLADSPATGVCLLAIAEAVDALRRSRYEDDDVDVDDAGETTS